ncbi:MAG: VCBS repeat-containing protein [Treponema sp.]|nr:VCBS repeat-containing protein [Treponema sp.]
MVVITFWDDNPNRTLFTEKSEFSTYGGGSFFSSGGKAHSIEGRSLDSLIAADLNGDGKQECIFTLSRNSDGYVGILDNGTNIIRQIDIQPYASGLPANSIWHPAVSAADYDQDGKDEICIIIGTDSASADARYVILDDMDTGFAVLHTGSVDGFGGNVVSADFTGDGLPDTVFFVRITTHHGGLRLLRTAIDSSFNPVFEWEPVVLSNLTTYLNVPRLAVGDMDGNRKPDVCAGGSIYTFKNSQFVQLDGTEYGALSITADIVMGDVTGDRKDDVVSFSDTDISIYYYSNGSYRIFRKSTSTGTALISYPTGCLPNVDDDSFILRDTGDREFLFTDPQVIAVLASPPYHDGINDNGAGGTSFGYSTSSGSGSSNSASFSVGISVGFEFRAPFNIASAEFETSIKQNTSWTQSSSVELSESWGWSTPVAQDLVIFTAVPFDVYYYEVISSPPGEDAKPGDMLTVNVPRKPHQYHVPLPNYNAGVPAQDRISLNHTLGAPWSYYTPSDRDQQKSQAGSQGLFSTNTHMTAGMGQGNTVINIQTVSGRESSFAFDMETEISAKATAGGVSVGASVGFGYGYESTSSVSAGTWIEGMVPAIPAESYDLNLDFDWGLMAYPRRDHPTQKFIFVTYWTKMH